ncbi:MAG: DUF2179 domain-containing protein [Bacteroidetes bacterium]|nr:MAG: DUF2179 domain-containing protein [Bacteroidota bacterium]
MDGFWFDYFVLPILILMARIVDVSMDTIRVILVAKGYRKYAPFVGFFQALVWVITITRVMVNLENWTTYVGYAAGFGLGTYIGMRIEEKLALGHELIRVITRSDARQLIENLRSKGYRVTFATGHGREGEVGILYIILQRKAIKEVIEIIKQFNPKAFYTIEDMRFVSNGTYLPRSHKLLEKKGGHR